MSLADIFWVFVLVTGGGCIGFLLGAMLRVGGDADKRIDSINYTLLVQRVQEMEYAVDAGNSKREDVPAEDLRNWFQYVWVG